MAVIIMVNITLNISAIPNMTDIAIIDTVTPFKYCVTPDYNGVLLGIVILLSIPYLFGINRKIAKRLNIQAPKDGDPLGTKLFKRMFNDWFYVGNAFYIALFFYLYNVFLV